MTPPGFALPLPADVRVIYRVRGVVHVRVAHVLRAVDVHGEERVLQIDVDIGVGAVREDGQLRCV